MKTATALTLEDLNAIYFATARQLILQDRCAAKVKLGLDDETMDVIQRITQSQLHAICKSEVPQFRLFVSARNLEKAASAQESISAKAWMILSRETVHANE